MATQKQPDGFFPHIFAGGVAGGVAAVVTSPLEVIKTRLQSSKLYSPGSSASPKVYHSRFVRIFKDIIRAEGYRALTKGLGVTLLGVIPSRAIYFTTYCQGKKLFSNPDRSHFRVHLYSSALTGLINVTWSNPLFVVRTRQQLQVDNKGNRLLSFAQCARDTYRIDGLRGFTRGISASYAGIAETVLALVLYEHFKQQLTSHNGSFISSTSLAAGGAKFVATTICYPHEVIRTRLRETAGDARKFKSFPQTIHLTYVEEGIRGLYRGLLPQLIRVVPNHAIMFLTFESLVRLFGGAPLQ